MSNGYDLKDIAANYAKKSDSDLIYTATQNARGLRPGVLEIIENELRKRNLDLNILEGVKAQNREYTIDEIEHLSNKLRNLACPLCGSNTSMLNGTIAHTVKSFIFFSQLRKELVIACPECLDRKNNYSIVSTALLGWWEFPSGIVKTPFYIYNNIKSKKQNRISKPNDALLSFTLENIGEIESYKDDSENLSKVIQCGTF